MGAPIKPNKPCGSAIAEDVVVTWREEAPVGSAGGWKTVDAAMRSAARREVSHPAQAGTCWAVQEPGGGSGHSHNVRLAGGGPLRDGARPDTGRGKEEHEPL